MAIEKNNFKVSRFDYDFSPRSTKKSISSDEDELQRRTSAAESDDDDDEQFADADSGAGSDDYDTLEWGDTGVEFCHLDNQTCTIPLELYDLSGFEDILSVDVWNECLTEKDRFTLSKFLPDMDQEIYMLTLKELFTGSNFHFGSPIKMLFSMLKGGLCEPRVALYRHGLNFFQRRQHYHLLRKHQNNMVRSFCQMRDAWLNCRGYRMEERLRVLNLTRSQKGFSDGLETESSSGEEFHRRFKDKKVVDKMPYLTSYNACSDLDFPSGGRLTNLEAPEYGKLNSKGTFKFAGSKFPSLMEPTARLPSTYHDFDINSRPYGSIGDVSQLRKEGGYDSGPMLRIRDELRISDATEETPYQKGNPPDQKASLSGGMEKGVLESGKRYDALRDNIFDNFNGLPLSSKGDLYGKNKNGSLFPKRGLVAEKPVSMRTSYNPSKKIKLIENTPSIGDQTKSMKGGISQLPRNDTKVDSKDLADLFRHKKARGKSFVMDPLPKNDDRNDRGKKWKVGMVTNDLIYGAYRSPSPQANEGLVISELRAKSLQKKTKERFVHKGGGSKPTSSKGNKKFVKGEETESDSSEQFEDDEDNNPLLRRRFAYPSVQEISQSPLLDSSLDSKKVEYVKKDIKEYTGSLNPISYSKKTVSKSPQCGYAFSGVNVVKTRQENIQDSSSFQDRSSKVSEKIHLPVTDTFSDDEDDDVKKNSKVFNNGQLQSKSSNRSRKSSSKVFIVEEKPKGRGNLNLSVTQSRNLHNYTVDEEDNSYEMRLFKDDYGADRFLQTDLQSESFMGISCERPNGLLLECNSVKMKRKVKGDVTVMNKKDVGELQSDTFQQVKDSTLSKLKSKKRQKADSWSSDVRTSEPLAIETRTMDMELDTKPQRNSFPLITPTVHTGFSFSIMHLLSAVRLAMITPLPEDMLEPINEKKKRHEVDIATGLSHDKKVNLEQVEDVNVPSLTLQDIVDRVKSNPGDPSILEMQEPLLDLVRGVLKIFSSKTAPLGAKGWKMLAVYEKTMKTWSWIGPARSLLEYEAIEEVTSPEAWGLPHKMLVKLVDSYANWLKSGQETLQLIGSLPAPPASLLQMNVDEKERFRDLRAQKSLSTISSSSEEVRDYFRREEFLRYSIPDRAFSYTAADGKKSIVAPLRRCGGKPTSKARDHFMLKKDRPPHVTILCLVRDAAARLPGSIGTRSDVCTLIRDSQYVVEDVSDTQVNQVVSGALDRLHYERDPCVQFDGERKLWVYLHKEREEEDFEDDGTSSTKKWKRPKKDAVEQSSDHGLVTVAYHASGEHTGYDICSDLNTEPPRVDDVKGPETIYGDVRQNLEPDIDNHHGSDHDVMSQGSPVMKASNPTEETKLICQENSTNEDFEDEAFARERLVGFLSASIS